MSESQRQKAIATLRTRVRNIRTGLGFQTNVGETVILGERPALGDSDPDAAVVMVVGEDDITHQAEDVTTWVPVGIQALAKASIDDPWMTVEAVIADIKQAVEIDHDLGGTLPRRGLERVSVAPLDREEGSTFVGAVVAYRLLTKEKWGAP